MEIQKSRIRSLSRYLPTLTEGQVFKAAVEITEHNRTLLTAVGFPDDVDSGSSIIPAVVGNVTDFNANGKEVVRKDLDKEPRSVMSYRTWTDWHDQEHSGIVSRTIQAYPREMIDSPGEALSVLNGSEAIYLASSNLTMTASEEERNLHVINMLLEINGSCQILDQESQPVVAPELRQLNWHVLPAGEYPWERARPHVERITENLPDDKKMVIEHRLRNITRHEPDFLAVGKGGFSGYFVLGFSSKNLFVFESLHLGNATYVFDDNWESLSTMTKKEILDNDLQQDRIVHTKAWAGAIRRLLS